MNEHRERAPGALTMERGLWQEPLFLGGLPWEAAVLVGFLAATIFYWAELTPMNAAIGIGATWIIHRAGTWLIAGDPFYVSVYLRSEGPGGYLPVYRCFSDAQREVRER